MELLKQNHRHQLLKELLDAKTQSCSELDLEGVVKKTEGCVAQDLCQLMDRVLFKACQRQSRWTNIPLNCSILV